MPKLALFLQDTRTSHELVEERVTIGSAPDNMIQIPDSSVSGQHAQVVLVGGRYQLKDLGSTNGTRVNNEPVTEIFLREGDRIRFGKVEARFESDATGPAQSLPMAQPVAARPEETSTRPIDFANTSLFAHRQIAKDPVNTAVMATAVLAILAFVISMFGLFQIHPPR